MSSIRCSPAIGADGTIYIGSWDARLYALDPDGSLKWSYKTGQAVSSSPAVSSDGTIYFGSEDGNIYALDPDGSLKWSYQSDNYVFSSPVIDADGTVYIGSHDGNIYALNPDGSLKWSYPTGSYVLSSPAIGADGIVYVGGTGDNKVYALDPEDGSLILSFQTGDMVKSSPAIGDDGAVYIGSYDGKVYALNHNFTLRWSFQTGNRIISSPAIAKDGTIYIGCMDCRVYAFGGDESYCFYDADNDGYGDTKKGINATSCPEGYVTDNTDCDDQDDSIYPGASELCDGKDNDCDDIIPNNEVDSDDDGHLACNDCNDNDDTVYPEATGTHEGKDNNCNGIIDSDEKKAFSPGYSYPTYMPLMLSPWLQPFQPGPMNYKQQALTPLLPSMQYDIYQQFPWDIGYQTPFYQNIFSRYIYQYNQPGSFFNQSYWSWPYFKSLNIFNNQFSAPAFYY